MNIITLLDMIAGVEPNRVAIGPAETGTTLAELRDLVGQAVSVLSDQPDRPLLFAGTSTLAFPVALLAAAAAGRPFAPVNYRLAPGPLRAIVEDQLPTTLIAEARTSRSIDSADYAPTVTPMAFLASVRAAPSADRDPDQDPERPAVLLHTSGTTGRPKVAVLRHRHLTSYVLDSTEMLSAGTDEAALVCVPPYHIAGVAGLLTGLYSGRRIVQLPDFDEKTWVETAATERITHAMVVPTMLGRIVDVLEESGERLTDLRHIAYGGGPMPLPTIERALALFPHVDFVNAYGLTETTSSIAVLAAEDHRVAAMADDPAVRARLGSVGRPLPSVEIVVRDANGLDVPHGVRGELWVRGPQVSGEYATTSRLADGWFPTQDGGWIDEKGFIFVEGRLDDVIVRGGENLSPGEIEDAIMTHPDVTDVAVYGVPDEQWGEVPIAAVVVGEGTHLSEQDVRDWVAGRLRSTRVPHRVTFLRELPRNEMGKVLRRVLKEQRLDAAAR